MKQKRPVLFKGRHFEAEIIVLCVRWYSGIRSASGNWKRSGRRRTLSVDHVTIGRWVQSTHQNLTAAAARKYGTRIGHGESTRLTVALPANGPIYIGRWIRRVPP